MNETLITVGTAVIVFLGAFTILLATIFVLVVAAWITNEFAKFVSSYMNRLLDRADDRWPPIK